MHLNTDHPTEPALLLRALLLRVRLLRLLRQHGLLFDLLVHTTLTPTAAFALWELDCASRAAACFVIAGMTPLLLNFAPAGVLRASPMQLLLLTLLSYRQC